MAFGNYKVNDRRGKDDPIRKPEILPCRVCGCPTQHASSYNHPTMDCIKYLRDLLDKRSDAAGDEGK